VVQSSSIGATNISIQFREFGIRLNFTPTITPRGTIKLEVAPEVSSLDYANGLTYNGFNIPGLDVRKIRTEVELENSQSFAIAGLLDNRVTENLSKVPGLGDLPILGKLFQSQNVTKNNTELMVVVTPELVQPLASGTRSDIPLPKPFMKDAPGALPSANTPDTRTLPKQTQMPFEPTVKKNGPQAPDQAPATGLSEGMRDSLKKEMKP
jgi:pilus assembly protein CpaC